MKKIGLVGGLSWVSTADYYKRLNVLTQERLGGASSARIVLESIDRQAYVDAVIERRDEDAACALLLEAAMAVERAGADFVLFTANDVHRFVPAIAPKLAVAFLHIAEATAQAIREQGLSKVALLGVRKTMEGDFYPEIFSQHGIETMIPNENGRAYIHDRIYDELVHDIFRDETREGCNAVIDTVAARGAQGVVLACTELPLLLGPEQIAIPSFSTTELHCRAAIDRALG